MTGVSAQLLGSHQMKKAQEVEGETDKKGAKLFKEFLHSSMDYPISQQCRIYQLEEIRIKAVKTPDELLNGSKD